MRISLAVVIGVGPRRRLPEPGRRPNARLVPPPPGSPGPCRTDYVSDLKWGGYLAWCDRFFWAVDLDFPADLLPPDAGLILADAWDADIQRWPAPSPLPGARRRALTQRLARTAAGRLHQLTDPDPGRLPLT